MIKYTFLVAFLVFTIGLAQPVHASTSAGDLIKCPDFSSVYYLAEDGGRYVFQNEKSYLTWYEDFSEVKTISCDDLSALPLAGVVHYQPGTRLLKLQTNPTVYYVEPNGVLRAITSENQAKNLFGDDWADRVDDLPDSFFPQYEVGEALKEGELPDGLLLEDDEDNLFRVEDNVAQEIDDLLSNKFLNQFSNKIDDIKSNFGIEVAIQRIEEMQDEILTLLEKLLDERVVVADEDEVEVEEFAEIDLNDECGPLVFTETTGEIEGIFVQGVVDIDTLVLSDVSVENALFFNSWTPLYVATDEKKEVELDEEDELVIETKGTLADNDYRSKLKVQDCSDAEIKFRQHDGDNMLTIELADGVTAEAVSTREIQLQQGDVVGELKVGPQASFSMNSGTIVVDLLEHEDVKFKIKDKNGDEGENEDEGNNDHADEEEQSDVEETDKGKVFEDAEDEVEEVEDTASEQEDVSEHGDGNDEEDHGSDDREDEE